MTTYTLYELNEYIRRVIALNLPNGLWVEAEIAQVGVSKGHRYLELVEKDEELGIRAQQSAALWVDQYRRLRFRAKIDPAEVLQEGMAVRLKVKVTFHERYGMKLVIEEVDAAYTIGKLAISRQLTIDRLYRENLVGKNAAFELPIAIQRIAVISSKTAAGLQDLEQQLVNNSYGYKFEIDLFPASVQGVHAAKEIIRQLVAVSRKRKNFDAVIIIRGGGAKLDLAAFDHYELCKKVAEMPIPVIVGIGHETDEPVIDLVAHTALKTPTAVANFLIDWQLRFEMTLMEFGSLINDSIQQVISAAQMDLQAVAKAWQLHCDHRLAREQQLLDFIEASIPQLSRQQVREANFHLDFLEKQIELLHPEHLLKRGYSITFHKGKALSSVSQVVTGDLLETRLKDGVIESRVE